jgi:hypothetical protein
LLDPSDQAMLWEWACEMLGTGDECTGEVRLAGDVIAQARATSVGEKGAMAGVLIEMRPHTRTDGRAPAARRSSGRRRQARAEDCLVGRSVATMRLRNGQRGSDEHRATRAALR